MSILALRRGIMASGQVPPFVGPMDAYAANLVAGFSVRRLLSAYVGMGQRARSGGTGVPEAEIPYLPRDGHLSTSALLTLAGANSGYVPRWNDQAGNARNAVRATLASQPRIVNAGTVDTIGSNARPTLVGTGTESLSLGDLAALELQDFTIYTVVSRTIAGAFQNVYTLQAQLSSGSSGVVLRYSSTNVVQAGACIGASFELFSSSTFYATTTPVLFVYRKSGSDLKLYEGITLRASGAFSSPTVNYTTANAGGKRTVLMAGWANSAVSGPVPSKIPEHLIFTGAHSDADRIAISNNISTYYGL